MKIAVTYDLLTGTVFQHFGKTQHFKVYEIQDNKIISSSVIDNGGFGHHDLATYLTSLGVQTLVLGHRGQGAVDALKAAGIKEYAGVEGKADDAINALLEGKLEFDNNSMCQHHHEHHNEH